VTARHLPLKTGYEYERTSEFGYACAACGRCCQGKVIPVNPYEVLRIARHLGVTTTEVLANDSANDGATLRQNERGDCVYFGERGCTVHPARPLACRLYPLGRYRAPDGTERFAEVVPHPESAGRSGLAGRVRDYLAAQGADAYIEWSDRYLALLRRMIATLAAQPDGAEAIADAEGEPQQGDWLDVDALVRQYCAEHGRSVPDDVDELAALHIEAVEAALEGLRSDSEST
jgi:Fe-S-cluster containining protein